MTQASPDDFFANVAVMKTEMHAYHAQLEEDRQKWLKTRAGKKQSKLEKNAQWWGLETKSQLQKFLDNNGGKIKFTQDGKAKVLIPQYEHRSQFTKFSSSDRTAMGTVSPTKYYYGIPKSNNLKFNKNVPLCQSEETDITENDGTNVHFVILGGENGMDTTSNRDLYCLYRASNLTINREPFVPDFTFEVSSARDTGLRLCIRNIIYGMACILKCNVTLNPSQAQQRSKLTTNNNHHWYEVSKASNDKLYSLFFDCIEAADNEAQNICVCGTFLEDLLKFLTKKNDLDSNYHWVLVGDHLMYELNGMLGFNTFFGAWRDPMDKREQFENVHDEYMFNMLNYIDKDECLCCIKAIEYAASRIFNILACEYNDINEDDPMLIVQCVQLMFNLDSKGDISAAHQSFMTLPGYIMRYNQQRKLKEELKKLDQSTNIILQSLRALGDLGAFDVGYLIKQRRIHRIWEIFFVWALYALLNSTRMFQSCLDELMKHVHLLPDQVRFEHEYRRFQILSTQIFIRHQTPHMPTSDNGWMNNMDAMAFWYRHEKCLENVSFSDLENEQLIAKALAYAAESKEKDKEKQKEKQKENQKEKEQQKQQQRQQSSSSASLVLTKPPKKCNNNSNVNLNTNQQSNNNNNHNDNTSITRPQRRSVSRMNLQLLPTLPEISQIKVPSTHLSPSDSPWFGHVVPSDYDLVDNQRNISHMSTPLNNYNGDMEENDSNCESDSINVKQSNINDTSGDININENTNVSHKPKALPSKPESEPPSANDKSNDNSSSNENNHSNESNANETNESHGEESNSKIGEEEIEIQKENDSMIDNCSKSHEKEKQLLDTDNIDEQQQQQGQQKNDSNITNVNSNNKKDTKDNRSGSISPKRMSVEVSPSSSVPPSLSAEKLRESAAGTLRQAGVPVRSLTPNCISKSDSVSTEKSNDSMVSNNNKLDGSRKKRQIVQRNEDGSIKSIRRCYTATRGRSSGQRFYLAHGPPATMSVNRSSRQPQSCRKAPSTSRIKTISTLTDYGDISQFQNEQSITTAPPVPNPNENVHEATNDKDRSVTNEDQSLSPAENTPKTKSKKKNKKDKDRSKSIKTVGKGKKKNSKKSKSSTRGKSKTKKKSKSKSKSKSKEKNTNKNKAKNKSTEKTEDKNKEKSKEKSKEKTKEKNTSKDKNKNQDTNKNNSKTNSKRKSKEDESKNNQEYIGKYLPDLKVYDLSNETVHIELVLLKRPISPKNIKPPIVSYEWEYDTQTENFKAFHSYAKNNIIDKNGKYVQVGVGGEIYGRDDKFSERPRFMIETQSVKVTKVGEAVWNVYPSGHSNLKSGIPLVNKNFTLSRNACAWWRRKYQGKKGYDEIIPRYGSRFNIKPLGRKWQNNYAFDIFKEDWTFIEKYITIGEPEGLWMCMGASTVEGGDTQSGPIGLFVEVPFWQTQYSIQSKVTTYQPCAVAPPVSSPDVVLMAMAATTSTKYDKKFVNDCLLHGDDDTDSSSSS